MAVSDPDHRYVSLQFCPKCDTAYAIQVIDGRLNLICRTCSFAEETSHIIAHKTNYGFQERDKDFMINQYSRYDRTLPVSTVNPCPKCGARAKFQKASDSKMSLMFFCLNPDCSVIWKT
jgi:DNA-directed RNA polymerase subunit M/transcription elongation factor TFIIS